MLVRAPEARLRPFVDVLWAGSGVRAAALRERVLPTGAFHVVLRLQGPPLRIFADARGAYAETVGLSVVGGVRESAYLREVSEPTASVGAQLRPGAAGLVLGVPALLLAGRHTSLDDLWGHHAVALLRERVMAVHSHEQKLRVFEQALLARVAADVAVHPAVAFAVQELNRRQSIADIVNSCGLSHRHFNALFASSVGLTPKRFARVLRFQRLVQMLSGADRPTLVKSALVAGYSDQPHLNHEFQAFSGLTPLAYLRKRGPQLNHVSE